MEQTHSPKHSSWLTSIHKRIKVGLLEAAVIVSIVEIARRGIEKNELAEQSGSLMRRVS
jgi:hypothetical protein